MKTGGNQTITATDVSNGTISGSTTFSVITNAATHFLVAAPASAMAGNAIVVTVTAQDTFNNTATGYAGSVHFASGDTLAQLPADLTLSNGVGYFAAIMKSTGSQTMYPFTVR